MSGHPLTIRCFFRRSCPCDVIADVDDLRDKLEVVDWSTLEPEFNQYLDWTAEQMKQYIDSLPPEALSRRKPVRASSASTTVTHHPEHFSAKRILYFSPQMRRVGATTPTRSPRSNHQSPLTPQRQQSMTSQQDGGTVSDFSAFSAGSDLDSSREFNLMTTPTRRSNDSPLRRDDDGMPANIFALRDELIIFYC